MDDDTSRKLHQLGPRPTQRPSYQTAFSRKSFKQSAWTPVGPACRFSRGSSITVWSCQGMQECSSIKRSRHRSALSLMIVPWKNTELQLFLVSSQWYCDSVAWQHFSEYAPTWSTANLENRFTRGTVQLCMDFSGARLSLLARIFHHSVILPRLAGIWFLAARAFFHSSCCVLEMEPSILHAICHYFGAGTFDLECICATCESWQIPFCVLKWKTSGRQVRDKWKTSEDKWRQVRRQVRGQVRRQVGDKWETRFQGSKVPRFPEPCCVRLA